MKKNTFTNLISSAVIAAMTITTGFAQTNLGAECGCPVVSSRATVLMSTLGVNANGELLANQTLTCGNVYTLDQKIYVPNGITLTIQPGTLIKGATAADPANATALIIERGGKIIADGKKECPIVFAAAADPMDGTYSMTNVGQWGGVVLLGKATNNLKVGNTYYGGTNGVGFIEGFSASNGRDLYGAGDAAFPTADDADNSGILRYVSIRNAGAILAVSNELNGLSLGSVGSGTTIEHIEIIACADDNIELFGGKVNIKYASVLFGNDDFFDYDLGWSGKAQFLFGIAGDSITGLHSTDNGFEADADDAKDLADFSINGTLKSHPFIYNVTLIGNGHVIPASDNSGAAAIQAKENTQGEIYNSIFAGFRSGLHLATSRSTATAKGDGYDNWTNTSNAYNNGSGNSQYQSLIVKNNTFIGFGNTPTNQYPITKGSLTTNPATGSTGFNKIWKAATAASAADLTQFTTTDGNSVVASVPGIDANWAWNTAAHTSYTTNPFHVTPLTNIASTITAPADGFFSAVNFRGAFDANKTSWLSEWALNQVLTSQQTTPSDLDNDGDVDVDDLSIFVNAFGAPLSK
ncbi:MAG: hypothetical protein WCK02_03190 [Bacteroidota bacterium]